MILHPLLLTKTTWMSQAGDVTLTNQRRFICELFTFFFSIVVHKVSDKRISGGQADQPTLISFLSTVT
ncbi:Uncharacterised protein [Chlamydia trachomatis]|nr:Uncharacterised protein [Chlamydia trachomatis]